MSLEAGDQARILRRFLGPLDLKALYRKHLSWPVQSGTDVCLLQEQWGRSCEPSACFGWHYLPRQRGDRRPCAEGFNLIEGSQEAAGAQ
jgi:hypothetical protein